MTGTIFITGARGKTGREVIEQLSQHSDVTVRGGSSQDTSTHDILSASTIVQFDWNDRSTWPTAVEGVDAIFLMRPDVPNAPELITDLISHAPNAHIVLLSEQGAETVTTTAWVRQVEDAVTDHAHTWTLLRPSWFQQVFTDPRFFRDAIRDERIVSLSSGGAPIAWIDTRDIAAVAVQTLVDSGRHHGKTYTLTGPDAITIDAIARTISSTTGFDVQPVDPPLEDAVQGLDSWTKEVVGDLFRRVHDGVVAHLTSTVEEVTGHPPRSVYDFIAEHHDDWRTTTVTHDKQAGVRT